MRPCTCKGGLYGSSQPLLKLAVKSHYDVVHLLCEAGNVL